MRTIHRKMLPILVAWLMLASACGPKSINMPPQVAVAQYGAKVLQSVREGQETVITLNKTQPTVMTEARTRQVLDAIKNQVIPSAEKLRAALVAYDAASSIDFKKLQAAEVAKLATEVAGFARAAFKLDVPQPLMSGLEDLALNIINLTDAIRYEMSKVTQPQQ